MGVEVVLGEAPRSLKEIEARFRFAGFFPVKITRDIREMQQVHDWLQEFGIKHYSDGSEVNWKYSLMTMVFAFMNQEDAALFAITWG